VKKHSYSNVSKHRITHLCTHKLSLIELLKRILRNKKIYKFFIMEKIRKKILKNLKIKQLINENFQDL